MTLLPGETFCQALLRLLVFGRIICHHNSNSKSSSVFPSSGNVFNHGPHGSNLDDVVMALKSLASLARGRKMTLDNDHEKTVFAFILACIRDMPQQQASSGFLSQRATRGCRHCLATDTRRGKFDGDIILQGRYDHKTLQLRGCATSSATKSCESSC